VSEINEAISHIAASVNAAEEGTNVLKGEI
jgi:hypothetical protein